MKGVIIQMFEYLRNLFGKARTTDPDTSHAAAEKPKGTIRARTLECISKHGKHGATGHEIAGECRIKLNSVTPRLAELRHRQLIKDSGMRRQGQVVWVCI